MTTGRGLKWRTSPSVTVMTPILNKIQSFKNILSPHFCSNQFRSDTFLIGQNNKYLTDLRRIRVNQMEELIS